MAEAVESAVVQEVVSGVFSFLRNSHEESASQSRLMERLTMAHLDLKFSLERSMKLPITEVSLLQKRMMLKHAFEECRDVLKKHTVLRVQPLSPSLPRRIMRAVKPFFSTGKGSISESCVTRFENFAEKADKFVRDVESGCSLARYRFSSPLVTQLLEGNHLYYEMVSGSQSRMLQIYVSCLEDYGAVAFVGFEFKDLETPTKCSRLHLMLRLSESTDIVGISIKCLQSLEPQFKPVADVASGELAQVSTQVGCFRPEPAEQENWSNLMTRSIRSVRQEPLCCIGDGGQPSAKNILPSELTERFPEQVSYVWFKCFISASGYNLRSSTNRNTIKARPILQLEHFFHPHCVGKIEDDKARTYAMTPRGEIYGPLDLPKMAEIVPEQAVDCFKLEPERKEYTMYWFSPHGFATFTVKKTTTEEMGCVPKVGDGPKTRRVSKRKL
ncbi:unnamed protein product [Alopecurus aequalis]